MRISRFLIGLTLIGAFLLLAAPIEAIATKPLKPTFGASAAPPGTPNGQLVSAHPISVTVDCGAGQTLASALALRPLTTSTLTITLKGTCVEAVDRVPGGVTINAAAPGDGLQAPNASTNPVLGIGGSPIGGDVVLNGLTISGGTVGLLYYNTGDGTDTNLTIEGASGDDVIVRGVVEFVNSTIENATGDGINVSWGGTVYLDGGTVQNNTGCGVCIADASRLDVFDGATISHNTHGGIFAETNAAVEVHAGIIENNGNADWPWGVLVEAGSVVQLSTNAIIRNNTGDGVEVYGGTLSAYGGLISNNSWDGVNVLAGGTAVLSNNVDIDSNRYNGVLVWDGTLAVGNLGGGATIANNRLNGIHLKTNSIAKFPGSVRENQIINNSKWGILCDTAPANPLIVGTVGTVTGNGSGQIACNQAPNQAP